MKSPSYSQRVVEAVPEHESDLDSSRARWWSGQSPSTRIVMTVPEHKDSRDSPRARWWSGQTRSTKSVAKNHMSLVLLFCIFSYLLVLSSPILTRLVKKVDGYNTSYCLFVLSNKQLRGTCY